MSPVRVTANALIPLLLALTCLTSPSVRAEDHAEINQLLRDGRLAEAQNRVDRQLTTSPKDAQLRLLKGIIQRESGRPYEAITTFTRLSEEHPALPEPYNNLAVVYASMGQYDKARQALEKALRTNPSYAAAHDNLAEVYVRLASQAYSKALQLESTPPAPPAKLAMLSNIAPTGSSRTVPAVTQARPTPAATTPPPAPVAASAPPTPATPAKPVPAPSSTPASPAATASSPPAAAPQPAVQLPATAAAPNHPRDVEVAVRAWAQAWSEKDMTQYLAAYAREFVPPGNMGRSAWEQDRYARITGKSRISVTLLELQITVQDNRAVAKFRQDYKADTLAVLSRKTLELVKTGNRWQIVKETSGS